MPVREFVLQRMAQRNDIGFARAVDTVERLGRDAHHRCDVDDRARATRDECRRGGIGQVRERGDVEGDDVVHLLDVAFSSGATEPMPALLTSMVMV